MAVSSAAATGADGVRAAGRPRTRGTASTIALASPLSPSSRQRVRRGAPVDHAVAERRGERVGEACDTALRLHEHRRGRLRAGRNAWRLANRGSGFPAMDSHVSSSGNVARADSRSMSPAYSPARSGATARSVASSPSRRRSSPPKRFLDSVLPLAAQQILCRPAAARSWTGPASGTRRRCRRGCRTARLSGTRPVRGRSTGTRPSRRDSPARRPGPAPDRGRRPTACGRRTNRRPSPAEIAHDGRSQLAARLSRGLPNRDVDARRRPAGRPSSAPRSRHRSTRDPAGSSRRHPREVFAHHGGEHVEVRGIRVRHAGALEPRTGSLRDRRAPRCPGRTGSPGGRPRTPRSTRRSRRVRRWPVPRSRLRSAGPTTGRSCGRRSATRSGSRPRPSCFATRSAVSWSPSRYRHESSQSHVLHRCVPSSSVRTGSECAEKITEAFARSSSVKRRQRLRDPTPPATR